MNISEFAKRMGTSKTTVYRKIAAAKLQLSELRDESGNLTDTGLSMLAGLLDDTHVSQVSHESYATDETAQNAERIRELERERDELREKLAAAQEQITALQTAAAERAEAHAAELADILRRQQANEAARLQASQSGILGRLRNFLLGAGKSE